MNGCVGIKATIGYVSTAGVVPAARSLDCLTCLARSVEDAALVMRTMRVSPVLGYRCLAQRPGSHAGGMRTVRHKLECRTQQLFQGGGGPGHTRQPSDWIACFSHTAYLCSQAVAAPLP